MNIVTLTIVRFRGIRHLEWMNGAPITCLIGPGDATKTTILRAIELALTPQRNVTFYDTDFFDVDTREPITIEVTLTDVPPDLLSEGKYGHWICGWDNQTGRRDEPQGTDAEALTVRLRVDQSLEPEWLVVNDRMPEGKRISAYDRARFGVVRIGTHADWQLTWGQRSALSALMDEREDVRSVLAAARRTARDSVAMADLPLLQECAIKAQQVAATLGVAPKYAFRPHLDVGSITIGSAILSLHDGDVPMRQAGTGTSRLLITALQHEVARPGGITLVDEVEHGLEPHRLRRLLHVLQTGQRLGEPQHDEAQNNHTANQVVMTTHSPVAVSELQPEHLGIVRSDAGETEVRRPSPDLRPLLRTNSEAFLARKVIVCEGKTELGFCRALDAHWSYSEQPMAYVGAALADGGGNTKGPKAAQSFSELGYPVAFFGDSDKPLNPDADTLAQAGVEVFLWDENCTIEQRIALDLSWHGFVAMVRMAMETKDPPHVRRQLAAQLNCEATELSNDPDDWRSDRFSEDAIRSAFGAAAKANNGGWFKAVYLAEPLGVLVMEHWDAVSDKPLGRGISALKDWIYA